MQKKELLKHLQNIKRLSQSPLSETTAQHIQALIVMVEHEYQSTPDSLINEIEDVLIREIDSLTETENPYNMAPTKIDLRAMRKRIFEKIRDKITGQTTPQLPVVRLHTVLNLLAANQDMRKDTLIRDAFTGTEQEANIDLYEHLFVDSIYDIFDFFKYLSEPQIALIVQYIMDNYKGVRPSDVEKYCE